MINSFDKFKRLIDGYYYKLRNDNEIAIILSIRKISHLYMEYDSGIGFEWLNSFELPINIRWILKNKKSLYIIFDNNQHRYYFCNYKELKNLLQRKNLKNMGTVKVSDEEINFYKNVIKYNL